MAQTTAAMSGTELDVEVSSNGSTWTNISGTTQAVETPEGTLASGEVYTGDGASAIITSGKFEPVEVKVIIVYTNESNEAFETIRPWYTARTPIYVRWSPKGIGTSGAPVFTTTDAEGTLQACPIIAFDYPGGDASEAAPVMASFTVKAPFITRTVSGSSTGLGS